LDAFWSINQQTIEKDAEVGRGFVIKHRDGRSRFPFKMGFDYTMGTLDIFEISKDRYKQLLSSVQQKRSEDIEFDTYSVDKKKKPFKKNENNSVIEADEE